MNICLLWKVFKSSSASHIFKLALGRVHCDTMVDLNIKGNFSPVRPVRLNGLLMKMTEAS